MSKDRAVLIKKTTPGTEICHPESKTTKQYVKRLELVALDDSGGLHPCREFVLLSTPFHIGGVDVFDDQPVLFDTLDFLDGSPDYRLTVDAHTDGEAHGIADFEFVVSFVLDRGALFLVQTPCT